MHNLSESKPVHLFIDQLVGIFILCFSISIAYLLISHHYQIDFSAYYSAAMLLARGMNPYLDSFTGKDGMLFFHSQFLQPPLVATLFCSFRLFPYDIAKSLWYLIQIPLIMGCLFFCASSAPSRLKIIYQTSILVAGSFFIFWPLYTLFERGQTDLLVLFWICLGYYFWKRGDSVAVGVAIVFAALFKLPAAFLLIVPVANRGWKPIIGASLTLMIVLGASLLINGIELNRLYFTEYLPEIIRTGYSTSEHSASGDGGYSSAQVIWDGKSYKTAAGFQAPIGSIVPIISAENDDINRGSISLAAFSLTSILILVFLRLDRSIQAVRLAWILALLTTLLFHPLTWVMNYVWLLAVVLIGYDYWQSSQHSKIMNVLTATGLLGMVMICVGEPIFLQLNHWFNPVINSFFGQKVSLWINMLLINRIWLGGSLLWVFTLAIILDEIGKTPFVIKLRKILSLH